jgi:hypothetical protein
MCWRWCILSLRANRFKSRHGVGLLASIAFSALPKVLELLRGSFSRALTLTFPRPTSLLRIYSNSHLAQTPDEPLDCHIILR